MKNLENSKEVMKAVATAPNGATAFFSSIDNETLGIFINNIIANQAAELKEQSNAN